MARDIKLPKLSENLDSGKVLEVKVAAGAVVGKDQPLLEVEAEKATVDVRAPEAGKILRVLVQKGEEVRTGQTLISIEDDSAVEAPVPVYSEAAAAARAAPPPPAAVARAAPPPPAAAPRPSPLPPSPVPDQRGGSRAVPASARDDTPVPAGPATRRLARELGVDLHRVKGTAAGGRVTQDDVKSHVKQMLTSVPASAGPAGIAIPPLPDFERWGPVERRPLEQVRRRTAEHLSMCWQVIPHVTQHDQCDITDLEAFRRSHEGKTDPGSAAVKLTITAFALKAAAIALRQYPQFNSSIDMVGNQLIVKQYVHVGVAVDTDRGLLVPVIRDVDRKSIHALAGELTEIADRARQKKLTVDDMRGGCFTITNLGGIGGTAFTPIVNWPEVAILGMSRGRLQPVVRDGQVVPRLILTLSLSYDHRVIDGADGARFLRRVCDMLENPLKMLL